MNDERRVATTVRDHEGSVCWCLTSEQPFYECVRAAQGAESVTLFQVGNFRLHSGAEANFKIECDVLTDEDWAALAEILVARIPPFGAVEGVPSGGLQLAAELEPYTSEGPVLIVDDVLTTGASMEEQRAGRDAIGAVVFARGECPAWVTPLFTLAARTNGRERIHYYGDTCLGGHLEAAEAEHNDGPVR